VGEMRIDGAAVEFREGETILEVARHAEVAIPTLCYDPRLRPGGSCRLCMVEIEGRPQPVAACTFPASAELSVRTQSEALQDYRRTLLELVLSTLPEGECRHCAEIGPCDLHRLAAEHGASGSRFRGATSGARVIDDNPFVLRDYEWCICCYRCTRFCDEVGQTHTIVPAGHGFTTRITTFFERGLMETACAFCGQCLNTCPTGALADRLRLGRAKAADIAKSVKTVCAFCGAGCTFYWMAGGRIVGNARYSRHRPATCVKGSSLGVVPARTGSPLPSSVRTASFARPPGTRPTISSPSAWGQSKTPSAPTRSSSGARRKPRTRRTTSSRRWRGRPSAPTTSITAPVTDTPQRSPVWRRRWARGR
jgi:formate dehydrogenase alpha subunit